MSWWRRVLVDVVLNPNPPRWADERRIALWLLPLPLSSAAILTLFPARSALRDSGLVLLAGWLLLVVLLAVVGVMRESQRRYYRSILQRLDGCAACGYPREGWSGPVCPECGVNADDQIEEARRVTGGAGPVDHRPSGADAAEHGRP